MKLLAEVINISRLIFDEIGKRLYETGVERVVIYRLSAGRYRSGTVWNGVTAITGSGDGGESTGLYADDVKYLSLISAENWKGSIEAYNYPDVFSECLGQDEIATGVRVGQQSRRHFGLCFTTKEGNDMKGDEFGYKIHLVYDVVASPSDKSYQTQSDSPEPVSMSWDISAGNTATEGSKPTAEVVLDYKRMAKAGKANVIREIENMLFGTENTAAYMPSLSEMIDISRIGDHLCDSDGNFITDSAGEPIITQVFE